MRSIASSTTRGAVSLETCSVLKLEYRGWSTKSSSGSSSKGGVQVSVQICITGLTLQQELALVKLQGDNCTLCKYIFILHMRPHHSSPFPQVETAQYITRCRAVPLSWSLAACPGHLTSCIGAMMSSISVRAHAVCDAVLQVSQQ